MGLSAEEYATIAKRAQDAARFFETHRTAIEATGKLAGPVSAAATEWSKAVGARATARSSVITGAAAMVGSSSMARQVEQMAKVQGAGSVITGVAAMVGSSSMARQVEQMAKVQGAGSVFGAGGVSTVGAGSFARQLQEGLAKAHGVSSVFGAGPVSTVGSGSFARQMQDLAKAQGAGSVISAGAAAILGSSSIARQFEDMAKLQGAGSVISAGAAAMLGSSSIARQVQDLAMGSAWSKFIEMQQSSAASRFAGLSAPAADPSELAAWIRDLPDRGVGRVAADSSTATPVASTLEIEPQDVESIIIPGAGSTTFNPVAFAGSALTIVTLYVAGDEAERLVYESARAFQDLVSALIWFYIRYPGIGFALSVLPWFVEWRRED